MLNEDEIIKVLAEKSKGFIGDDAAILPLLKQEQYIITKDILVEDVHFRMHYCSPQDLAHKAINVNLSDIAAMGAKPQYILCGLSAPSKLEDYVQSLTHSLPIICKDAGITLIGGDTTGSPDKLYLSITAIGTCASGNIKYRCRASTGDCICVAGNLGWAHLGLTALENGLTTANSYKTALLRPKAKTNEGIWLGQQPAVTSMMDISDGVYIDLTRLCANSGLCGVIDLDSLPVEDNFLAACEDFGLDPIHTMLAGGEDYGLLFTVKAESLIHLAEDFAHTFSYEIKCLGNITPGSSPLFIKNGASIDLKVSPFNHFEKNHGI